MTEPPQQTFAEQSLILIDRMERSLTYLKEILRQADEFLEINKPGLQLPNVRVQNENVQSLGVSIGISGTELVVKIAHRGDTGSERIVGSKQQETWEFTPPVHGDPEPVE